MSYHSDLFDDYYPCDRAPAEYCREGQNCSLYGPCEGCFYLSVRHCGELPDDECPGRSPGDARVHCDCYVKRAERCCHCAFMKPAEAGPPAQEQK